MLFSVLSFFEFRNLVDWFVVAGESILVVRKFFVSGYPVTVAYYA